MTIRRARPVQRLERHDKTCCKPQNETPGQVGLSLMRGPASFGVEWHIRIDNPRRRCHPCFFIAQFGRNNNGSCTRLLSYHHLAPHRSIEAARWLKMFDNRSRHTHSSAQYGFAWSYRYKVAQRTVTLPQQFFRLCAPFKPSLTFIPISSYRPPTMFWSKSKPAAPPVVTSYNPSALEKGKDSDTDRRSSFVCFNYHYLDEFLTRARL